MASSNCLIFIMVGGLGCPFLGREFLSRGIRSRSYTAKPDNLVGFSEPSKRRTSSIEAAVLEIVFERTDKVSPHMIAMLKGDSPC